MNLIKIAHSRLPKPWMPIENDNALALGRMLYSDTIADTVQDELQREICEGHPLYGVECSPVAYDADTGHDFLFLTGKPGSPFILVHFTWKEETQPEFPFIIEFRCFDDFIRNELEHHQT